MNKFQKCILYLACTTIPFLSFAQQKSCCSTQAFASLGDNQGFISAHAAPEPINFRASKGSDVAFDTPDGKKGKGFLVPASEKSSKYLLVFHEWWGLNDYIRQEAEKYATDFPGINILALDLYDGKNTASADEAAKLMQKTDAARCESIIRGALAFAGKDASVQTVGWCFGGGWSLQASIIAGNQSKGCVIYYGMPENDQKKLQQLAAPVLGIFASQDGWINKNIVDGFISSMNTAGKQLDVKWFNADHAFANPSNPKFNQVAAGDARRHTLAFIRGNFGE
jgi:carboxymethylenebutenolidase